MLAGGLHQEKVNNHIWRMLKIIRHECFKSNNTEIEERVEDTSVVLGSCVGVSGNKIQSQSYLLKVPKENHQCSALNIC